MTADVPDDLTTRLAHAREQVLREQLAAMEERVGRVEADLAEQTRVTHRLERQLEDVVTSHKRDVARLRTEIGRKRLDRQLRTLLSRGWRALASLSPRVRHRASAHVAIVCPVYPGGRRAYGGEFIRARVRLYREAGLTVTVFVVPTGGTARERYDHEGVTVIRIDAARLVDNIRAKAPDVVAVHHLTPHVWAALEPLVDEVAHVVWVHGYEARDWRELAFNYTDDELEARREALDAANEERRATLSQAFADDRIQFVFVSAFMRGVAERFAGRAAVNGTIIPNVIDEEQFPYRPKQAEHRHNILWVRSFSARNYANDLARDAVLELADRPGFDQLTVTVVGDGPEFAEIVAPLRRLPNVEVSRGFVSTDRLRALHADHGIMLVPTRWDSQGLTCGEAMSSGLVPVTNAVAAIPEFVPEDAGMLCPPDDPVALADAIARLQEDPEVFLQRSERASRAAREICGRDATVRQELRLLAPLSVRLRNLFGR